MEERNINKIYLQKAIFHNLAPFEHLELNFDENDVALLSGINGKGKTTILSYIADAYYEMAKKAFKNEFANRSNSYYRVASSIYNINLQEPSFVYIRFFINGEFFDYISKHNKCTEEQYKKAINIENGIPYNEIDNKDNNKTLSNNLTSDKILELFNKNLLTFFPSYRYEEPQYLNDIYRIKFDYKKELELTGYLKNRIEVITDIDKLANWILDVVLDNNFFNFQSDDIKNAIEEMGFQKPLPVEQFLYAYTQLNSILVNKKSIIQKNLNIILNQTLKSKHKEEVRFGIGNRKMSSTRIQVVKRKDNKTIYPSIFFISSGEAALLCLFGELLHQADNILPEKELSDINGIVLIDEIDKHLHIKLQKEVLPTLLNLFPNVQFIVSSHSPFLSMGLAEVMPKRARIFDLDNEGMITSPTNNDLYTEVYDMMVNENERFKEKFDCLKEKIEKSTKPIVITEGKTDIQHLQKAMERLNIKDIDILYYNGKSDREIEKYLDNICNFQTDKLIIGMFDRDNKEIVSEIEKNGQVYKNYGNHVFGFCIPVPTGREMYNNISIEFYYSDKNLKNKKDGKSLYFDNELHFDKNRNPTELKTNVIDDPDKKIFDNNIGKLDYAHSKSRFADLVETDEEFTSDFDFSNFNLIFDRIKQILSENRIDQ